LRGAKEYTDEFLRQKTREEFYDEQKRKKTKKVSFVCFFKNTMKTKKIIFISADIIIKTRSSRRTFIRVYNNKIMSSSKKRNF